ncbi:hypothetical protein D1627_11755 [Pontibacter oryzae]|uniref:Uncharacterized protein n=1 Tax=Pontibacter oryzae TaxID=2304593 RepID=A0A399S5V5_9BACT|nr:hypothetical protein D1627_11755 [Pontibacter oryzae]
MLLAALLFNGGFLAAIFLLSKWYSISNDEYVFHMICLNLTVFLMYLNKHFNIAPDYSSFIKFFISLVIVHVSLAPFRNGILKQIKHIRRRFSS